MKPTILALASEYKGTALLEEAKRQGCRVLVLMNERIKQEAWPWHAIDEVFEMPDVRTQPDVTYAVSYLTRERKIDRIVALDDYDVETAAALREHLRLDGMGDTAARLFRDKLANRTAIKQAGIQEPRFTGIFNNDEINDFLNTVPAPWVLKPRLLAGSEGINKFEKAHDVWQAIEALGDQKSYYLLEQFIPGDVFHVDGLVWQGKLVFSLVSKYGVPPMTALQGRGVFSTRVLDRKDPDAIALTDINEKVITSLGRTHGPTHTEFIKAHHNGEYYFLETAARVAGGNIDKLIESATDIVMWQEAARIEVADFLGEKYNLPKVRKGFAGLIAAPSKHPFADTSAYTEPEIKFRPSTEEFVSLIVATKSFKQTESLLATYAKRFQQDFMS